MTLYANECSQLVSPVFAQTNAATDAMPTSTHIPAAPTIARCHLFRSAHELLASTYGTGVNTRNIIPITCTSPPVPLCFPNFLQLIACPISWHALMHANARYSQNRLSG